jgi:hypothetical protein
VYHTFGAPWVAQLWTKDLKESLDRGRPVLRALTKEGTTLTAQITATGLFGTVWEPCNTTSPFAGAREFADLSGGPDHIKWRYDPIIPTVHDPDRFRGLAEQAARLDIQQSVINFIAPPGRYKRVDRRVSGLLSGWDIGMPGYDDAWKVDTVNELVEIAGELGLTLAVCAESAHLAQRLPGVERAVCGDRDWFIALSGKSPNPGEGRGSRPGCGCAPYFDVGLYGQWRRCHQCLYCYAG